MKPFPPVYVTMYCSQEVQHVSLCDQVHECGEYGLAHQEYHQWIQDSQGETVHFAGAWEADRELGELRTLY
jgi:hypothetical protein